MAHPQSLSGELLGHYTDQPDKLFQAALETIRSLPGWEVLTAHPEDGEIRALARGRIFTPTREHVLHLATAKEGTDVSLESIHERSGTRETDSHATEMFRTLLEDRLEVAKGR